MALLYSRFAIFAQIEMLLIQRMQVQSNILSAGLVAEMQRQAEEQYRELLEIVAAQHEVELSDPNLVS
jgi:hypothetical protein